MPPSVSVVIPTHNRGHLIRESLDSVFAQTYQDFEVIVVDDGSTDNTEAVLLPYMNRIRYIKQTKAGVSAARNRGMLAATGEYIAFLDSDDLWMPTKLEKCIAVLASEEDIGLVYSDACSGDAFSQELAAQFGRYNPPSGHVFECFVDANYMWTPTVVIRRSVLAQAGLFDASLQVAEDYDFFIRVAYYFRCHFVPEVLVFVRHHSGNTMKDIDKRIDGCRTRELQAVRWAHLAGMAERFSGRAAAHYADVAYGCRVSGMYDRSVYCYNKAALYSKRSVRVVLWLKCAMLRLVPCIFRWYDSRKDAAAGVKVEDTGRDSE